MSASVIFPCTIKSRRRFLLVPAHPGSPIERAVKLKRLCVCVCVCTCSVSTIISVMFVELCYRTDAANISFDTAGSDFTEYLAKHGMCYSFLLLMLSLITGHRLYRSG